MKNILLLTILISYSAFGQSNMKDFFLDTSKNCYSVGSGETQIEALLNSIINIFTAAFLMRQGNIRLQEVLCLSQLVK